MAVLPRVRRPAPAPEGPLPRWWFYGRPLSTHQLNALCLVLPRAERFMLAAVRPVISELSGGGSDHEDLLAQARAFCAQEACHAAEHRRVEPLIEAQGFDLEPVLGFVERAFSTVQRRLSPRAQLALTVGLEHYGAIIGSELLEGGHTVHMHPRVRSLLEWHAAEEVEHRSVAFDLWQATGGGYVGRVLGFVAATALQSLFRVVLSRRLLAQDDAVDAEALAENRAFRRQHRGRQRSLWRAVSTFLRPSFHPSELDDDALIARFLDTPLRA